jgi:hypothetical protein
MKMPSVIACLAVLSLSACANTPQWKGIQWGGWPWEKQKGGDYQPLTDETADIAVPKQARGKAEDGSGAVLCRVSKGTAKFDKRWLNFETEDFTLPPDTRVTVTLTPTRTEGEMPFQAWFSQQSQEMLFCPVVAGPPTKKIPCAGVFALDEDLEAGIKRTFDIPGAVMGGVLTCAYSEERLKK